MMINYESERIWKEAAVAQWEVPWKTKKTPATTALSRSRFEPGTSRIRSTSDNRSAATLRETALKIFILHSYFRCYCIVCLSIQTTKVNPFARNKHLIEVANILHVKHTITKFNSAEGDGSQPNLNLVHTTITIQHKRVVNVYINTVPVGKFETVTQNTGLRPSLVPSYKQPWWHTNYQLCGR
jgi:hypothetical protein